MKSVIPALIRRMKAPRDASYKALLPLSEVEVEQWYQLSPAARNERNLHVIEQRLIPYPTLVRRRAKKVFGGHQVVYFHVPKTGGTTIEYLLAKNHMINGTLHVNAPNLDRNPWCLIKGERIPRVLMGHYELNDIVYQCLDRKLVHLTMLRDPVKRVLSYYDYLQTKPQHPLHSIAASMSITDFMRDPRIDETRNFQTLRVLGLLRESAWQTDKRSDEQLIEDAKTLLAKRFSIVGVTEQFDAFLLMCQRLLGWQDIFCGRHNVSRKKTLVEDLSDADLDTIVNANQLDIELHGFARKLSEQRCEQLGIDQAARDTYQANNQAHLQLMQQQRDSNS